MQRVNRRLDDLQRLSDRYAWARLAVFVIGAVIALAAFFTVGAWLFWLSTLITVAVFVVGVHFHRKVQYSIIRHRIWSILKTTQIARIELDWERMPPHIAGTQSAEHPFSRDLNLTGKRSILQLVDTAISRGGSQRLLDWLSATTPDLPQIEARQAMVRELAPMTRLRDRLFLNATFGTSGMRSQWDGTPLRKWLEHHPPTASLLPRLRLLAALAALDIILVVLNSLGLIPALWELSFLVYLIILLYTVDRIGDIFEDAAALAVELERLKAVFQLIETYPLRGKEHLQALLKPFRDPHSRPSTHLRRLARIVSGASLRRNYLLWFVVNAVVPWEIYFAYRLNQCKADLAALLPVWLDTWFELEALSSLATFAYLNPEYTFPTIVPEPLQGEHAVFRGIGLGHPLLPYDRKVTNDFAIDHLGEVVIITGSNMSGKSSFLRTLGVNLCLTFAGGPVNAQSLQTCLFRLFTSIEVSDSVTDGISYFYAEVKRLKALLGALEQENTIPLFFLIDEIFRGTNNRERLIGSRSYVRALVGKNGIGVISTHDLELIRLADEIPTIKNEHFEDSVIDGRMVFDYKLRPGPCPSTNALRIMQIEGLPVET